MNKRKVLIPLDGSDFCREILPQIRHLFAPDQFQLHLVHVADHPAGHVAAPAAVASLSYTDVPHFQSSQDAVLSHHPIFASQERDSLMSLWQDELRHDVRILEQEGYEVVQQVFFGEAGEEIIRYVRTAKIDLIAMTTHGRTGLRRLLFGSVAEQVARTSPVPVMLLRPFDRKRVGSPGK